MFFNFKKKVVSHEKDVINDTTNLKSVSCINCVDPRVGKYVAYTFDCGPCIKDFAERGKGVTESILDILKENDVVATFNIIGSTVDNYPDGYDGAGSTYWNGTRFSHYPCFGKDSLGGAVNHPEIIRRIIDEGHDLSNYGYRHIAFGNVKGDYSKRTCFNSIDEVVDDLDRLHTFIQHKFGYTMRFAKVPYKAFYLNDGTTSDDVFAKMGYTSIGASYGLEMSKGHESYQEDVEAMIVPMARLLDENENALNGQIIALNDGCNDRLRTPVIDALPKQIELLKKHGYTIVSVADLLIFRPKDE